MITEQDLLEAIAECEGERNPNAQTCRNLAAFYTILDHVRYTPQISHDAPPAEERVAYNGDSEFARLANGMNVSDVLGLMDELMDTVQVLQPRLYDAVMRKMKEW